MNKIKTGDNVIVLAGKDKGKTGTVLKVLIDKNKQIKVIIESINMCTEAVRANPKLNQQGGLVKKEAPLQGSKVALVNPATGKADRVGFKFISAENNKLKKVRYFKSNGELVDTL